jgi:hypothetical protein
MQAALASILGCGLALAGCSRDWDAFDPRLGPAAVPSAPGGGGGGAGGAGTGASSASGGGGGAAGAGGGPGPCGKMGVLADDFAVPETAYDWKKLEDDATVVEAGGELTLAPKAAAFWVARYEARRLHDARGERVVVEVVQPFGTTSGARTTFTLRLDTARFIEIVVVGGNIQFRKSVVDGGSRMDTIGSVPFDPVAHRWWGLRVADELTHWETSADGKIWIAQAEHPNAALFSMAQVQARFGGDGDAASFASAGTARFDNFNGGVAQGSYCTMETLTDDFDDGFISPRWARSSGSTLSVANELGGALVLTVPAGAAGRDYNLRAATAYDLTDAAVTVESLAVPSPGGAAELVLDVDGSHELGFRADTQQIAAYQVIDDKRGYLKLVPYLAADHRWWRLRHDAASDKIFWEHAPDGKAWLTFFEQTRPSWLVVGALDVRLRAATVADTTADAVARFDNFNLPP